MPLNFSDEEMAAIQAAAEPIPYRRRREFLEAVASVLAATPAIGPGNIHRVVCAIQREFLSGWVDGP